MGNEMGNSNVTGLQNQDNIESEAPVISSEASVASINVNDNEPEKNRVASSKESDHQVEDTASSFEVPSEISHPQPEKEASDKKEINNDEVQVTHESSKAQLLPNNTSSLEPQSVSSSKTLKGSSGTSGTQIHEQTFVTEEMKNTDIEITKDFLEALLIQKDSKGDQTQLVQTCEENSSGEGVLVQKDSTLENNPSGACDPQFQNQTVIDGAGEEMMDSFLNTNREPLDDKEVQLASGSSRVLMEKNDANDEENQSILAYKNEEIVSNSQLNSPERIDQNIQDQQTIVREVIGDEGHIPSESSETFLLPNDTSNLEQQTDSSSETLKRTVSTSCEDSSETSVTQIQEQAFVMGETGNNDTEVSNKFLEAQPVQEDFSIDEQPHIIQTCEGNSLGEEASTLKHNEQHQNQILITEDGAEEETMNSFLDTTVTNIQEQAFAMQETEKVDIGGAKEILEAQLVQKDLNDEPPQLGQTNKDNSLGEKAATSDKNPSGTCDQQFQNQTVKDEDNGGEEMIDKNQESPESSHIQSDTEELTGVCVESPNKRRTKPERNHEVEDNEPHESDGEVNEIDQKPEGSITAAVVSVVWKDELYTQKHEKLPDIGNINERKLKDEACDVNPNDSKEQEDLKLLDKSGMDLQLEVLLQSAKSIEPIKFQVSECNEKIKVPDEVTKAKIKSEVDENKKTENGCQVNLHENGPELEKMAESIVNNGSSSIEFTATDISVSNFPILEEKSKNVGWEQSIVDSKHKTCCNEVDVPNQASNIINSTGDHDSHTDYFTAESKENPNTRAKQQAEFSSKVSNKSEFSFDLGILLAEIYQVPMPQCDKQDADHHNSIPHGQTMNTKDGKCLLSSDTKAKPPKDAEGDRIGSFLSSDLEPKESVNTSTEQKKEKVSIHAEVAALLSSNTRIEDSDRSPLPYNQEQTVEKDVFELKSFRNATLSSKFGVNAAGADSKTDQFTTINSEKEGCGSEKELQGQEFSSGKQVIALEHSDSEKLKIPLLSFMKERSNIIGSLQKQENPNGKRATEDKKTLANETRDYSPPGKEKRKMKSSFFSNCICCAAVIQ